MREGVWDGCTLKNTFLVSVYFLLAEKVFFYLSVIAFYFSFSVISLSIYAILFKLLSN